MIGAKRGAQPCGRGPRAGGLVPQSRTPRFRPQPHRLGQLLITLLQLATISGQPRRTPRLSARRKLTPSVLVWELLPEIPGVCWCCAFKRHDQEYKHPGNIQNRRAVNEIPLGLIATTLVLFLVAIAKPVFQNRFATIYGVLFNRGAVRRLHCLRTHQREQDEGAESRALEEFNLDHRPEITERRTISTPGQDASLVAVRDYTQMSHLLNVLEEDQSSAAMISAGDDGSSGDGGGRRVRAAGRPAIFRLRKRAVHARGRDWRRRKGKTVDLLVGPRRGSFRRHGARRAANVKASRLVSGCLGPHGIRERLGRDRSAWPGKKLPEPRPSLLAGDYQARGRPSVYRETWVRIRRACGRRTWTVWHEAVG